MHESRNTVSGVTTNEAEHQAAAAARCLCFWILIMNKMIYSQECCRFWGATKSQEELQSVSRLCLWVLFGEPRLCQCCSYLTVSLKLNLTQIIISVLARQTGQLITDSHGLITRTAIFIFTEVRVKAGNVTLFLAVFLPKVSLRLSSSQRTSSKLRN